MGSSFPLLKIVTVWDSVERASVWNTTCTGLARMSFGSRHDGTNGVMRCASRQIDRLEEVVAREARRRRGRSALRGSMKPSSSRVERYGGVDGGRDRLAFVELLLDGAANRLRAPVPSQR